MVTYICQQYVEHVYIWINMLVSLSYVKLLGKKSCNLIVFF